MAERYGLPVELLNARVTWTPEPPAETQQDDEVERAAQAIWESQPGAVPWSELSPRTPTRDKYRRYARAALAARPSTDTETLRRVRELADALATTPRESQWLHLDALRAALDWRRAGGAL
jgi:hypothetical protein